MFTGNGLVVIEAENLQKIISDEIENAFAKFKEEFHERHKKYISKIEASEKLGVSLVTLWKWDKDGILPSIKINKKVVYEEYDLEQFLESRKYKKS